MRLFFSVADPSGDLHAANLARRLCVLDPAVELAGMGGPRMAEAGVRLLADTTSHAVMGIVPALRAVGTFRAFLRQADHALRRWQPDGVVLVDAPGFNWWIAHYAKRAGIPVYYYMPPQLWAWGGWRVKRVRKNVDHVLSGLSFETEWYRQHGVETTFVGHPFFEAVANHPVSDQTIKQLRDGAEKVVGLLPGSRKMELTMNWPVMLETVDRIASLHPECRFIVGNHKPHHREFCKQKLQEYGKPLPISFEVGRTSEVIEAADCCLMVSGSVSLELLARKTPAVVLYKGGWVMGLISALVIKCKYITLPNLISGRELLPEFPFIHSGKKVVARMTSILDCWLSDPDELKEVRQELAELADEISESRASRKTAEFLLDHLGCGQSRQKAA